MKNSELLDTLLQSAEKTHNTNLINKLNDKSNIDAINLVSSILNDANLTIIEKDKTSQEINLYYKIARALTENYFTIYYVDLATNKYIGYSSSISYNKLKIAESGDDFFNDAIKNAQNVIYKDDIEGICKQLTVENIIEKTKDGNTFTYTYRLLMHDVPTYVQLKAIRLSDDNNVIIGISNIDEQKKNEINYLNKLKKNVTYSKIAFAIAQNYYAIYYVNWFDSSYDEYIIDSNNQELTMVSHNIDFFADSIKNAKKLIHKDDIKKFLNVINKDYIQNGLRDQIVITLTYRVKINNHYKYSSLKIVNVKDDLDHFIVAVSDVDSQMRKEVEYEKNLKEYEILARTDGLTGALNKYSYSQIEELINKQIKIKTMSDFAVVVCDINNLKHVNDTKGHDIGDKYIIEATNVIKSVFKNSLLYRIGGDEFTLILEGSDYYKRDILINELLKESSKHNTCDNIPIIACGMADYNKNDKSLVDVFNRADELMYNNKKQIKGIV